MADDNVLYLSGCEPVVRRRRRLAWYLAGVAVMAVSETSAIRRREYDDTVTHYVRQVTPSGSPAHFAAAGLWLWAGWHLLVDKRLPTYEAELYVVED